MVISFSYRFLKNKEEVFRVLSQEYSECTKGDSRSPYYIREVSEGTWNYLETYVSSVNFPLFGEQEILEENLEVICVRTKYKLVVIFFPTKDHHKVVRKHGYKYSPVNIKSYKDFRMLDRWEVLMGMGIKTLSNIVFAEKEILPVFGGKEISHEEIHSCPWEKVNKAKYLVYWQESTYTYKYKAHVYGIYDNGETFFYFIDTNSTSLYEELFLCKWKKNENERLNKEDICDIYVKTDKFLEFK